MPRRESIPVDRSTVEREGPGRCSLRSAVNVDELVLADAVVHHGESSSGDKSSRRGGREAELVRTAFSGESPFDDGERTLRL